MVIGKHKNDKMKTYTMYCFKEGNVSSGVWAMRITSDTQAIKATGIAAVVVEFAAQLFFIEIALK